MEIDANLVQGRSPSGKEYAELMLRQNKVLGNMLGAEIDFIVKGIDSKTRSVVASRREAMLKKRQPYDSLCLQFFLQIPVLQIY